MLEIRPDSMDILKMMPEDWPYAAEIYREGILSGQATIVREVPEYADWDETHHPRLRFVAKDRGKVLGFICVHEASDGAGLVSVYVADNKKRQGVGSTLLESLQRECREYKVLRSLIFRTNAASIGLHQKKAFEYVRSTFLNGDSRIVEIWEWEAHKSLYFRITDAIVDMNEDGAVAAAKAAIGAGLNAWEAIQIGLIGGMERAGILFEKEEYFIPELLMCADAMNAAMEELKPHVEKAAVKSKGRIVIGTAEGDTHDIGKNIVALMLRSAGYDVLDLGRDVDAERFVEEAVRFDADIIAISSLMTTTMGNIAKVPMLLEQKGLRDRFVVMAGGRPLSPAFAQSVGADCYAKNAAEACRCVRNILVGKTGDHRSCINVRK